MYPSILLMLLLMNISLELIVLGMEFLAESFIMIYLYLEKECYRLHNDRDNIPGA